MGYRECTLPQVGGCNCYRTRFRGAGTGAHHLGCLEKGQLCCAVLCGWMHWLRTRVCTSATDGACVWLGSAIWHDRVAANWGRRGQGGVGWKLPAQSGGAVLCTLAGGSG